MNEKVDMKEGCARLSFLFVVTKWQDNNVIYIVYYVQILNLCMMGAKGVHIKAMNTGHDGSLSTGHANSIEGMLKRLEAMFLQAADFPVEAIRSQITEGIDIMIHMSRMKDGSRSVTEISELKGMENGEIAVNPLFRKGSRVEGSRLIHREKLQLAGYEAAVESMPEVAT